MNDTLGAPASLSKEVPRNAPFPALTGKRQQIVLVVGPPESGTSLCAYVLNLLGVDMTDALQVRAPACTDAFSEPGDWGRQPVSVFHDRILGLFCQAPVGPSYDFALPVAWWADPRLAPIRTEMANFLEARLGAAYFGVADPRTTRLLPVWRKLFADLKLTPKLILCLRNPAVVSRRLHERDGLDPELAEYRWLVHMTDFFRYADKIDHCIVPYEEWADNASANLEKLQSFLGLEWHQGKADRRLVLSSISALAESIEEVRGPVSQQPIIRSFYELVRSPVLDPERLARRDQIIRHFTTFQQLQLPIERLLAANAASLAEIAQDRQRYAAKCEALSAELTTARATLADGDTTAAHSRAELDALKAELTRRAEENEALQARLEASEAMLAAAHSEREDAGAAVTKSEAAREALRALVKITRQELEKAQRGAAEQATASGAAVQSAHAESAELHQKMAMLQAQLGESEAALAATRSERDTLQALMEAAREELSNAHQTGQEQAAALEAALQSAKAEVAAAESGRAEAEQLRAALRQAEENCQVANGDADRLQCELANLRTEVAQAEGRAGAAAALKHELATVRALLGRAEEDVVQQNAQNVAIRREIAALQGALTAARQVGRAAMQALATPVPVPPTAARVGWLQALKRHARLPVR